MKERGKDILRGIRWCSYAETFQQALVDMNNFPTETLWTPPKQALLEYYYRELLQSDPNRIIQVRLDDNASHEAQILEQGIKLGRYLLEQKGQYYLNTVILAELIAHRYLWISEVKDIILAD